MTEERLAEIRRKIQEVGLGRDDAAAQWVADLEDEAGKWCAILVAAENVLRTISLGGLSRIVTPLAAAPPVV